MGGVAGEEGGKAAVILVFLLLWRIARVVDGKSSYLSFLMISEKKIAKDALIGDKRVPQENPPVRRRSGIKS